MSNRDDPSSNNKTQLRVVDDVQMQSVAKSLRESTNGMYWGWWGGGALPIMDYMGRLHPKRGTFFRLDVCKRVGISRVEV